MNRGFIIITIVLLLVACSRKESPQVNKDVAIEFINVVVHNAKPTIVAAELTNLAPNIEAYQEVVVRNSPGTPPSFDLRLALARAYYRWGMYQEAGTVIGGIGEGFKGKGERQQLMIFISLLNGHSGESSWKAIGVSEKNRSLLLSNKSLNAVGTGDMRPAIAELGNAINANRDWREVFENISFVDRMIIAKHASSQYGESMGQINESALKIFLSGSGADWNEYVKSLKKGEPAFMQTILFEDMMAIMSETAEIYAIDGEGSRSASWLSKLQSVVDILSEKPNNESAWVSYLLREAVHPT
jgi:hypothetical protein